MSSVLRYTTEATKKERPDDDPYRTKAWSRLRVLVSYGPAVRVKTPRGLG
jgi:hypothetical protein